MNAKTPETAARVALENIADLPEGQSLIIHGQNRDLYAKRLQLTESWFLRLENPRDHYHSRFCDNKGQLLEDLEYFYRTDSLPRDKVISF